MNSKTDAWLLLVTNLPGRNQTLRMRLWRALKAAGAALLRDGVYVLPHSAIARGIFDEQRLEIQSGGGSAHVLSLGSESAAQHAELIALFDRTTEYQETLTKLNALKRTQAKLTETEARKRLSVLRRDAEAVMVTDFFPGEARAQIVNAFADAEAAFNARFSIAEPHAAHRRIPRHEPKHYAGRTWATRERLWIDRVCSAWLIKRFIDRKAKFIWLKRIKDCPKRAVGFDFDGAEFTHVNAKVTFEVLLASFGLEHDAGLVKLASMVHQLDVGGIPVAEASGFAAIVRGARTLQPNDDALLKSITPVLDCLYAALSESSD